MERNRRLRESLADSDVFGALTDEELDRLIAYGNPVRHSRGHVIFQKGETGDSLMVMGCGRLFEGSARQMHAPLPRRPAVESHPPPRWATAP